MTHTGGAQGQAADIAIVAKEILKTREKLNKIYVSHTGKDVEAPEWPARYSAYGLFIVSPQYSVRGRGRGRGRVRH